MPAWVVPAITAAGSIIGGAIAKGRNERQISQQNKLNQMAVGSNKELALYNKSLQMDMWRETGPTGQMDELKKAGLNPGLIYGMGGAGGQTANAAQATGVQPGQAHGATGNEEFQATSMGLELATRMGLMKAQKENIEADTDLKRADATKTSGIDTTKAETDNRIAVIEEKIKGDTAENAINAIRIEMLKANQELEQSVRENYISEETKQTKIDAIKQSLVRIGLENILTRQLTAESSSKIKLNEQQIKSMATKILQDWEHLNQGDQHIAIEKFNAEIKANYPGVFNVAGKVTNEWIESLFEIVTGQQSKKAEKMK